MKILKLKKLSRMTRPIEQTRTRQKFVIAHFLKKAMLGREATFRGRTTFSKSCAYNFNAKLFQIALYALSAFSSTTIERFQRTKLT